MWSEESLSTWSSDNLIKVDGLYDVRFSSQVGLTTDATLPPATYVPMYKHDAPHDDDRTVVRKRLLRIATNRSIEANNHLRTTGQLLFDVFIQAKKHLSK